MLTLYVQVAGDLVHGGEHFQVFRLDFVQDYSYRAVYNRAVFEVEDVTWVDLG